MARYGPIIRRRGHTFGIPPRWRRNARRAGRAFNRAGAYSRSYNSMMYTAKHLARMVNTEVKQFLYSSDATTTWSGTVYNVFQPAAGTGESQRIGSSCKPLHLTIRGVINVAVAGNEQQLCRVIIFRGKNENGVAYTPSDILESSAVGTAFAPVCTKNWDDRFRTKILYDKTFVVNKTAAATEKQFKFSKKLFGHTQFHAATTDVENGGIYVLTIADTAANGPHAAFYMRTSFSDS